MAGYDLSFFVPFRYLDKARDWLRHFQRLATKLDLQVVYRKKKTSKGRTEIYVTIDGPLYAMQCLYRQLSEIAAHFLGSVGMPVTLAKHVIYPFVCANEEGLKDITDFVFGISDYLAIVGGKAPDLAISTNLIKKVDTIQEPHSPDGKAIKIIIRAFDNWLLQRISKKETVMLCDQGIQEWLRARLSLPISYRGGFHQIVNRSLQNGLITKMEAYRLRRYHCTRNRVKYRGVRVTTKTVLSMFNYYIRLINIYS